ncbi:MAG: flagellar basal body rod protein FlgB [Lachnospiraceae bacterium]|nr:flagellar basal body rod protein FlgB [Lachnospiraceae bacterium]
MISSSAFHYVNVLDKAADASWQREQTIANNIANVDTPGYKRQDVEFESVLKRELGDSKYTSLDDKISSIHLNHLQAKERTEYAGFAYRLDGNNVDIDTENVELASETLRYLGLTDSINQEFTRLKSVIK